MFASSSISCGLPHSCEAQEGVLGAGHQLCSCPVLGDSELLSGSVRGLSMRITAEVADWAPQEPPTIEAKPLGQGKDPGRRAWSRRLEVARFCRAIV